MVPTSTGGGRTTKFNYNTTKKKTFKFSYLLFIYIIVNVQGLMFSVSDNTPVPLRYVEVGYGLTVAVQVYSPKSFIRNKLSCMV